MSPRFSYFARDKEGRMEKGELLATSERDLARKLRDQGLILTAATVDERKKTRLRSLLAIFFKISLKEKILFTRHLFVMIRAGLSISKALSILARQTTNKKFKRIIISLKEDIEKGKMLSSGLEKYPKVFSPLYINMVHVGEVGGKLEEVLNHLATQLKKERDLIVKVRSAMMYPVIVVTTIIIVVVFMLIYVLPQLVAIFKEVKAELPLTTRMIIAFSDFITNWGIFVAIGFVILFVLFIFLTRTEQGRKKLHFIYLITPILGPIVKQINLARFARTLHTLLVSGVDIVKSLEITSSVVRNNFYKKGVLEAAGKVKKGEKLVVILEENEKLFPPLVTQMIAVGEETGTVDLILKDLASFYEKEVARTMNDLASIIEPVLLVLLGLGVAIVALSIISPIYSLVEQF